MPEPEPGVSPDPKHEPGVSPDAPYQVFKTEDDFNKVLSLRIEKDTKALRREADELRKQLEASKQSAMSEQEKAIEAAKAEGAQSAAQEWRGKAIKAALAASGMTPDKAAALAKLAPDDADDPVEAVAALREQWPELFAPNGKRPAPGGDGPQRTDSTDYSPEAVEARLRDPQFGMKWYRANRTAINDWRRAHGLPV